MKTIKTIKTVWEVYTFHAGFAPLKVGEFDLNLVHTVYEPGTEAEYYAVRPTDAQIRSLTGVRGAILTRGDDTSLDVERARDGFPLAELNCVSHRSLSWKPGEDGPPLA